MLKKDAERLARELIDVHLPGGEWEFKFDGAKRRAGLCNYDRRTISLSGYLVETTMTEADVRETLLHEIAHAIAVGDGHGPEWKRVARSIGCTGERCHTLDVSRGAKYYAICECDKAYYRFRRPDDSRTYRCRVCKEKLNFTPNRGDR